MLRCQRVLTGLSIKVTVSVELSACVNGSVY